MTTEELLVLFSSYVITFFLICLVQIADDVEDSITKAAREDRAKHEGEDGENERQGRRMPMPDERTWNVTAFFGLK